MKQEQCGYAHEEPQEAIGHCKDCGKPVCEEHSHKLVDGRVQCNECVLKDMELEIY